MLYIYRYQYIPTHMYVFKIKVKPCATTWRWTQTCARHKQCKPWTWLRVVFFLYFFLFFFLKLQQPLQTIWHTKAAATMIIMMIRVKQMMIKFASPLDNGQTSVPAGNSNNNNKKGSCCCWDLEKKRLKRNSNNNDEKKKNKNRSDKFVDLSKAKADQEMQASHKKNRPKLVSSQAKKETTIECTCVCMYVDWANGYHVSGTWLKLKYSVISSAQKKDLKEKNERTFKFACPAQIKLLLAAPHCWLCERGVVGVIGTPLCLSTLLCESLWAWSFLKLPGRAGCLDSQQHT